MKIFLTITTFLLSTTSFSQKKTSYLYAAEDTVTTSSFSFYILNEQGDTLKKLSREKYFMIFNNKAESFFVAGMKGYKNWQAIDKNENILFQIYNQSYGEPTPDYLRNDFYQDY